VEVAGLPHIWRQPTKIFLLTAQRSEGYLRKKLNDKFAHPQPDFIGLKRERQLLHLILKDITGLSRSYLTTII
jgi:hypothetical protein